MQRAQFDRYVEAFNRRDYDAVLEFWAPEFSVNFVGYEFKTPEEFRNFYRFLHHYLAESIHIDEYIANDRMVVLEARVRIEGIRAITPEELRNSGFGRMGIPELGQVIEIPQFIHYHLKDGKFESVICAVSAEPRVL